MPKVFCPECQNIVSSFAEACPGCGFPIKKYIKEAKLSDFSKTFICPKCGSFSTATDVVHQCFKHLNQQQLQFQIHHGLKQKMKLIHIFILSLKNVIK